MIYKNWNITTTKEQHGIVVDYSDSEGNRYSAPFCFHTYEEARRYGKLCVDQLTRTGVRNNLLLQSIGQNQVASENLEKLSTSA